VNHVTFKELARLKFGPLSEADREVYRDVRDEDALIAYSHDKTFIIIRSAAGCPSAAAQAQSRAAVFQPGGLGGPFEVDQL
jgi:hypothetical protein